MKKLIFGMTLFATLATSVQANYCAGIRGNGELAMAHWGAMARIVENKGMPETLAGGSSAAITLLYLDAVSRNHLLSEEPGLKAKQQALLMKSFMAHMLYIFNEDAKAPAIMRIMGKVTGMKDGGFIHKVKNALAIASNADEFMTMLGEYGPLFNPDLALGLRQNFKFYKGQAAEGAKVFGSFDSTDPNLFFRRGLVDFKYLGMLFGRVADFYAGYGNDKTNKALKKFTDTCGEVSFNKSWYELIKAHPECNELATQAFDRYYEYPTKRMEMRVGVESSARELRQPRRFPNKMIFEKIGSGLNILPTTSMVKGDAVKRYQDQLNTYESSEAKIVPQYTVDFDKELSYIYWGREEVLNKIGSRVGNMYPGDLKSSKFEGFSDGTWFEVLATSPAEPGLARLQRFPHINSKQAERKVVGKKYFRSMFFGLLPTLTAIPWIDEKNSQNNVIPVRPNVFSGGGWSDLHPSLILRASGCDDIMYVTRQDGESVFGQQIFIRLTGYTDKIPFWRQIKDNNRSGWFNLSPEAEASPWNRLYNLGNPNSSFNRSVIEADSVYCTDWNSFKVFKGEIKETILDAWNAPLFLKDESRRSEFSFGADSEGHSDDGFPGCLYQH